jgi:hypothetical protein
MDFCFARGLRPNHASCDERWTPLARRLLYVRSHWLRMPLPLLVRHLVRKALVAPQQVSPDQAAQPLKKG